MLIRMIFPNSLLGCIVDTAPRSPECAWDTISPIYMNIGVGQKTTSRDSDIAEMVIWLDPFGNRSTRLMSSGHWFCVPVLPRVCRFAAVTTACDATGVRSLFWFSEDDGSTQWLDRISTRKTQTDQPVMETGVCAGNTLHFCSYAQTSVRQTEACHLPLTPQTAAASY